MLIKTNKLVFYTAFLAVVAKQNVTRPPEMAAVETVLTKLKRIYL